MKKKDREIIPGLIVFTVFVFYASGIDGVFTFWHNLAVSIWGALCIFNQITLGIVGDSILTLTFKSSITFLIVGIIIEIINAPRGKFGHYLGKGLFWVVGLPVSFILNFIGSLLF